MKIIHKAHSLCAPLAAGLLLSQAATSHLLASTVTIDGSMTYQTIDGFGVNANHRSWTNSELQPVLDALIDQAGMTLFRVVYDKTDWDSLNSNPDPNVLDWGYYNNLYSSPDFEAMWGLVGYLNQRGMSNGVSFNFQGTGPAWMMDPINPAYLSSGAEDYWARMVASLLIYARTNRHLQFGLVEPANEPDNTADPRLQGILMTANQHVTCLDDLAVKLDSNGVSDLRMVGPDLAYTSTDWMSAMMNDPVVMGKLAHFGLHSYQPGGTGSVGMYDFLQQSAYPDRNFWMTEFNAWCDSCENCSGGDNSWAFARGTASYLLNHLANGASAGLVWEGYDSFYKLGNCWSYWGLMAIDDVNAASKTYTPRKGFYTVSQISRFVRPGARHIALGGSDPSLPMLAFYHTDAGQITIVGVNSSSSAATLSGTLTNLPAISRLDLYYTDAQTNLCHPGSVSLLDGGFAMTIPPDCVFTLCGTTQQTYTVTLKTTGSGKVSPDWDGRALAGGKTYTFVAIPDAGQGFAGWTGSITSAVPRLAVTLSNDLVLEADFVPGVFIPASGVYSGLFHRFDETAQASSGFICIATTGKARFSGRLQIGSLGYPLSGFFDSSGRARVTTARGKFNILTVEMQMDLASGADTITGTVSNGIWTAGLCAQRAAFDGRRAIAPEAGQYTFAFAGQQGPALQPAGSSFGGVSVNTAGRVRLACWLADGTVATGAVLLSTNNETPLYLSLYGGKGSLQGWLQFAEPPLEDLSGVVNWFRPNLPRTRYYPNGFAAQATVFGSRYQRPARGERLLSITNAEVVFEGGALAFAVTNNVILRSDNRVMNLSNNKLTLQFVLSSGRFKGSAVPFPGSRAIPFGGMALQNTDIGCGYFLNANQSGRVLFRQSSLPQ